MLDVKALKKLAEACRKAGIKHYKCSDFEFTLTDELPHKSIRKASKKAQENPQDIQGDIESDELSQEQLLMWSVTNTDFNPKDGNTQ